MKEQKVNLYSISFTTKDGKRMGFITRDLDKWKIQLANTSENVRDWNILESKSYIVASKIAQHWCKTGEVFEFKKKEE